MDEKVAAEKLEEEKLIAKKMKEEKVAAERLEEEKLTAQKMKEEETLAAVRNTFASGEPLFLSKAPFLQDRQIFRKFLN